MDEDESTFIEIEISPELSNKLVWLRELLLRNNGEHILLANLLVELVDDAADVWIDSTREALRDAGLPDN